MLCVPAVSDEVVSDAPPLLSVAVPRLVVPSTKVTVPVEVDEETVAVNVTAWRTDVMGDDEASAVVVPALFTVCVTAGDDAHIRRGGSGAEQLRFE